MKKLYTLLFALLLAVGILTGCGGSPEEPTVETPNEENQASEQEEASFPLTITDALDNEVVIEAKPEKIVSLIPSNTEIAYALGLGEQIVGVSDFDNFPEEVVEKEKIGNMEINIEKIISLSPNLVLAHASSAHNSEAGLQQLKDAGIAVLVVNDAQNLEDVYKGILMVGSATGELDEAETIVADMKEKIEEIQAKVKEIKETDRKTVFVEVSPAPEIYSVGANTFMNEMLQIINAKNVVSEDGWPKMDPEAVIERNPDVIITTHGYYTGDPVSDVVSRDGWQDITAVKNEQVVDVDSDMVTRTGPRIAQGVEEIAKAVYPEIFNQ
ncbi:iron complex transport system substrate-binding protein [Mesobacillus persicus]|uniref:Iron complex transport system substrate-binding protein n=1 Tax=Mesobacillus persicus TaxID=930146 RepID=A0A1H7VLX0_9BACI|nr:ABC transporter substrate-binding protein [Mesobacillus persicus]SEM09797.1 iron complex transport system substrate-binding protein [Mesobacillus persicus]